MQKEAEARAKLHARPPLPEHVAILDRIEKRRPQPDPALAFLDEFRNNRELVELAGVVGQFAANRGDTAPLTLPWNHLTPLP